MNNKIVKLIVTGAVAGTAVFAAVKIMGNSDKSEEKIKDKKIDIKNFDNIKEICNKKLNSINDKDYTGKINEKLGKLSNLKSSLLNKQSSTSVVFGNPTYNVYKDEGRDKNE